MASTPATNLDVRSGDNSASSASPPEQDEKIRVALLGNPNTGKTTLFNRLCGLRARTANFPGITVDSRIGQCTLKSESADLPSRRCEIVDLPGIYQLSLDLQEVELCNKFLRGEFEGSEKLAVAMIVVDATNLSRNLKLVAEVRAAGHPLVVALNMIDIAQRKGLTIDADKVAKFIGAPVVAICAKNGAGTDELRQALLHSIEHGNDLDPSEHIPDINEKRAMAQWADRVVTESVGGDHAIGSGTDTVTDRLDAAFTHPILGILVFGLIMGSVFSSIFWFASIPMDFIDWFFGYLGSTVGGWLPPGDLADFVTDGIIAGVGSVVIFLPQICLLFFLISLLEDTGYLARAAFVMDRLLCRFGLPGQAFIPLLSSHACAIPGIMSTKLIPDPKDRLTTILVSPFMSCSARVPVYVLLTAMLFGDQPLLAGLAFFACYILGAVMAMISAFAIRRTLLPGRSRPMVLELPTYKMPSVRSAIYTTIDRSVVFLRNAGTTILAICMVLWWLNAYPRPSAPPAEVMTMRAEAAAIEIANPDQFAAMMDEADLLEAQDAQARSFIGRLGHLAEPVFRPIGYDWKLSVGVLTSFAAREVFVSTMGVLISGTDEMDVEDQGVLARIRSSKRDDGTPLFTKATSASLLVFFVLAMQCLPTLAVTKRETASWKWAGFQLAYMSILAYGLAFITYQGIHLLGVS